MYVIQLIISKFGIIIYYNIIVYISFLYTFQNDFGCINNINVIFNSTEFPKLYELGRKSFLLLLITYNTFKLRALVESKEVKKKFTFTFT